MSTSALILMILVQGSVVIISTHFLIKVLKIPPKTEFEENDENLNE